MQPGWSRPLSGAGNGVRTRDIKLGKLALYQLSYARIINKLTTRTFPVKDLSFCFQLFFSLMAIFRLR
jgi:hypothetical protein